MKKLLLIVCISCLYSACNTEPDDIRQQGCIPEANLIILNFSDSKYLNNVVAAQHPVYFNWDLMCYHYENDDSTSLFLYKTFTSEEFISFVRQKKLLVGSSPYIPLTDDYYLIDWKWYDFYPLCAYFYRAFTNQIPMEIKKFSSHTFYTNTIWGDLNDIADTFDISQSISSLEGVQAVAVAFRDLDKLYNEDKGDAFYLNEYTLTHIWNDHQRNGSDSIEDTSYLSLMYDYDSLQNINQQRLIEIIRNGKLQKIEYR